MRWTTTYVHDEDWGWLPALVDPWAEPEPERSPIRWFG